MNDPALVNLLNEEVKKYIRWCTPSVLQNVEKVADVYGSDVSASFSVHGNPIEITGIFDEAMRKAAKLYNADRTLFSVNGSTGSVYVVMRYLSLMYGNPLILATRNIHISVQNACEDFGIRYRFIRSYYDPEIDAFIPPTPDDVREALERHPEANAVFLSNPTYEGLSCRLRDIVRVVNNFDRDIIVIVDEAWGSHFKFSDKLPETAMDAGADISIQSTHKQGGSLQQTGMIHWKERVVDSDLMLDAYRGYATTSPSYHLLASLDATRSYLERKGREEVERIIRISEIFRDHLRGVRGLIVMDKGMLEKWRNHISGIDLTKTQLVLTNFDITGFQLDTELQMNYMVVPEKADYNSVLFLTTFQLREESIKPTVDAIESSLKNRNSANRKELLFPPLRCDSPKIEPYLVRRMPKKLVSRRMPLDLAQGMVSAENIVSYPPGVPILIRGFMIRKEDVEYLRSVKKAGGIIIARDMSLKEVEVLRPP